VFIGAVILLLWFASSGVAQERQQSGLPERVQSLLDSTRKQIAEQAELADILMRAETARRQGEAHYKGGDHKAAEASFESARQVLLSTEERAFYAPGAHSFFLELTERIASLKREPVPPSLIAVETNNQVQTFIRYYQSKGRAALRTAFARLGRYQPMMQRIFQEERVPVDLIYVGLVESAYNPYAQSVAGAKGIWQFVETTGRRYGLRQAGGHDERSDPEKSTRAAARYLRDLYALFGDWQLALAAYNAGEYRVLKIIEKTGIRDFWQMSRQKLLPEETTKYVPAVLAAMALAKHADVKRKT
jgi:soluble lytic murein transglycosylase-like protein